MVQSRWEWGNSEANQTKSPQFRLEHRSWISNLLNHQIPFLLPFQIITYSSSVNYWIWVSFNFLNTSPIWVLSSVEIEKVSPPRPNLIYIPFLGKLSWKKNGKKRGHCPLLATPPPKRIKRGHLLSDYRQKCVNGTRDILMLKARKMTILAIIMF